MATTALLESDPHIKKDAYLIINTSSADRSMDVLPKLFHHSRSSVNVDWCSSMRWRKVELVAISLAD
jgi:hypothetical protein